MSIKTIDVNEQFKSILEASGMKHTASLMERIRNELNQKPQASTPVRKAYQVKKEGDPHVTKALQTFLNTDEKKVRIGNYFIDGHELYYRAAVTRRGKVTLDQNLIAKKLDSGLILGNSSVLDLIGRKTTWGHERNNRGETEIQQRLSRLIPMLPFNVFTEANLNLDNIQVLERGLEEQVTRLRQTDVYDRKEGKYKIVEETVHFTGSSLFKVDDSYFLFDIDRREIKHKIFNAFLVKLAKPCQTITEAYDSLKPQLVKDAESKGIEVKRQGEFFFIPVDNSKQADLDKLKDKALRITLSAGQNRPNYARGLQLVEGQPIDTSKMSWNEADALRKKAEYFVKGKVEHSGREHAALILKVWCIAVANTSSESFTIRGDVD